MYKLYKDKQPLSDAAPFDVIWDLTIEHYGHMTLKEFDEKKFAIVKTGVNDNHA